MKQLLHLLLLAAPGAFAVDPAERLPAAMIWTPEVPAGIQAYVAFRTSFPLEAAPADAKLHIFADSRYLLWVNGVHVSRGPARFHPGRPEYDTLDLTPQLRPGGNTLAVLVHHYAGATHGRIIRHAPGLAALLDLDGREMLRTSPSWRASAATEYQPSPGSWSSIPDVIDGRKWPGDWTAPGFADDAWTAAVPVEGSGWGPFHPRTTPLPLETHLDAMRLPPGGPPLADALPVDLHADPGAGRASVVIDLGRMAMAYPTLELEADEGAQLQIEYALRFVDGRPAETYGIGTTYTARAGRQSFMAADQWCARYVTIHCRAGRVRLLALRMTERRYPYERLGRFSCTDPMLTHLWEMAVHTIEVTTDDAHGSDARERNEWVQDGGKASFHTMRPAAAGPDGKGGRVYSDPRTLRKLLIDAAACQMPDGRLPGTFPTDRGAEDPHHFIDDYALQWVESLRLYVELTGDDAFLREMWPALVRQMDWFLARVTPGGLLLAREYSSFDNPIAYHTCEGATINAFFHHALRDAAWLGTRIGESEAVAAYIRAAEALSTAANARLWNESEQAYSAGIHNGETLPPSVHAQLMALYGGLAPPERRPAVQSWFLRHFRNPGAGLVVGARGNYRELLDRRVGLDMPIMYFWAFTELYRMDTSEADLAAVSEMRRRWANMVRFLQDAGTLSESFVNDQGGGISESCHNYGAIPAYFLSSYILGIRLEHPVEERRLVFDPRPADLPDAAGVVVTPFGPVPVEWSIRDAIWQIDVTLPEGVQTGMRLPGVDAASLRINDAPVSAVSSGRSAVVPLAPGRQQIRATLVPAP